MTTVHTLRAAAGLALAFFVLATAPVRADDIVGGLNRHLVVDMEEEDFVDIARRYDLGYVELVAANPWADPWLPDAGEEILLPTAHILPAVPRKGIVINLSSLRLYYFPPGGGPPRTWPIGIGRDGFGTPLGKTRIVRKRRNPTWTPTATMRRENPKLPAVVPPGPDNPLGRFALDLAWPAYLIHGTNKPPGVGRRVSHGCIRMYPEDIKELFALARVGTPVTVIDEPVKIGWHKGEMYLEVHVTKDQIDQIEARGTFDPRPLPGLRQRVLVAAGAEAGRVDWEAVERAAAERRGYPIRVTRAAR